MATRFDEYNCAAQCKKCNAFEQGRDTDFAQYISQQYGAGIDPAGTGKTDDKEI